MNVDWIYGKPGEPLIQVHHYDEHTVILRQSKRISFEAPFVFLLFGNERAFLLDTGATEDHAQFPLRATVDGLIDAWLAKNPRENYELIVAHTHGHGDHVAGDAQFVDRPLTTVVPRELEAVQSFFGLGATASVDQVPFDLGGRVLQIIASPGHHAAAITTYDPWTGILFTGDTVYPGRLYVFDYAAFNTTLDRLVAFTETHPVKLVLGCHIEMTRKPGRDYAIGTTYHPNERALEMTTAQLKDVRDATASIAGKRGLHRFDDFIIFNEPSKRHWQMLIARGRWHQALDRVFRRAK